VILAEDLERLVVRRASLVNEIVNALLPGYQFRSLLNRRILSSDECQFFRMMLSRPRHRRLCSPISGGCWCGTSKLVIGHADVAVAPFQPPFPPVRTPEDDDEITWLWPHRVCVECLPSGRSTSTQTSLPAPRADHDRLGRLSRDRLSQAQLRL
jgi:hypothetical protein